MNRCSKEWDHVSGDAKDLVRCMLVVDPAKRLSATEALQHPWIVRKGRSIDVSTSVHLADTHQNLRNRYENRGTDSKSKGIGWYGKLSSSTHAVISGHRNSSAGK